MGILNSMPNEYGELRHRTFGHLFVVNPTKSGKHRQARYVCKCTCGNFSIIYANSLKRGVSKSCGKGGICHHNYKHGQTVNRKETKTFRAWSSMKSRCTNPAHENYFNYGGRGITICDKWLEDFENFLTDMGEAPNGLSLDRIDNSKGYYKENCWWATDRQQQNNTRYNRIITLDGISLSLSEWCRRKGIPTSTLANRIYSGMSEQEALTKPIRFKNK